jgi:hypothetical protein
VQLITHRSLITSLHLFAPYAYAYHCLTSVFPPVRDPRLGSHPIIEDREPLGGTSGITVMSANVVDYFCMLGPTPGGFRPKPLEDDDDEETLPARAWQDAITDIHIFFPDSEVRVLFLKILRALVLQTLAFCVPRPPRSLYLLHRVP